MRIVYHCYGGTHSSVLGAAMHVGLLDGETASGRVTALPFFDRARRLDAGRLRLMGRDEAGNPVFFVGRRNRAQAVKDALRAFGRCLGITDWVFVNTTSSVGPCLRLGGFLSRRLGLEAFGRPFLRWGARSAIKHLDERVEMVRALASTRGKPSDPPVNPTRVFYIGRRLDRAVQAAYLHIGGAAHGRRLGHSLVGLGTDEGDNEVYAACLAHTIERRCVLSWLEGEGLLSGGAEAEKPPVVVADLEGWGLREYPVIVKGVLRALGSRGKEELPEDRRSRG